MLSTTNVISSRRNANLKLGNNNASNNNERARGRALRARQDVPPYRTTHLANKKTSPKSREFLCTKGTARRADARQNGVVRARQRNGGPRARGKARTKLRGRREGPC